MIINDITKLITHDYALSELRFTYGLVKWIY